MTYDGRWGDSRRQDPAAQSVSVFRGAAGEVLLRVGEGKERVEIEPLQCPPERGANRVLPSAPLCSPPSPPDTRGRENLHLP